MGRARNDLGGILEAIQEVLPDDAVLYLEGSRRAMTPELLELLEANPSADRREVNRGTVWPRSSKFHVPASAAIIQRIRDIEAYHAEPEICDHLVVYRDGKVLLTAYDTWDAEVWVSKAVSEADREAIRRILGFEG